MGWGYAMKLNKRMTKKKPRFYAAWIKWHHEAQQEMEFRYALKRISVDTYKEQFNLGRSPHQGAQAIASQHTTKRRQGDV